MTTQKMKNRKTTMIAIANQKGGVGKTTTAINLADALRHIRYDVLFIDMDPQHNSTSTYGAQIEDAYTIVDVLKKDCTAEEAIQHTPLGDIIPGDTVLSQEEGYLNTRPGRENLLKIAIEPLKSKYDFIIMDTPPNLGIYMLNALTAADGCIIPIKAEQYAIDGLSLLIETINEVVANVNSKLKIYGVLLTAFDARNRLDKRVLAELPDAGEKLGFRVFKTPVRISQDVKNVQSMEISEGESRSLFENFPSSNASADYVAVVKEALKEVRNG